MIVSFRDSGTESIFNGENSRDARRTCPQALWRVAVRKLEQLDSVVMLEEPRMVRIPTHRAPVHPGEMLLEEFLLPMGITQRELADAIETPYQRVNEIVNGKRGITPSTALRLARFFDMTPDFWMNLQLRWDLYHAQQDEAQLLARIAPHKTATLSSPASA